MFLACAPALGLERNLAEGLRDLAGPSTPSYLDDVLRRTARSRQRRAWPILQRSVFPARVPRERDGWATGRLSPMTPLIPYAALAALALAAAMTLGPLTGSSPPNAAAPSVSSAASPSSSVESSVDPMALPSSPATPP